MGAAAEVRRANQLIYDQIAALRTFIGDSDAWYDWQKNFRRSTREFDNDLKYRVLRLKCGDLAERRLDEALSAHPVPDGGDPYQLIFSMVYMWMRTRKIMKFWIFCKLSRSLMSQFILLSKDLRNNVYVLKIWALSLMMSLQEKFSWMGSHLTSKGNYKKEQDQGVIKG
jgi:hypothetical protein